MQTNKLIAVLVAAPLLLHCVGEFPAFAADPGITNSPSGKRGGPVYDDSLFPGKTTAPSPAAPRQNQPSSPPVSAQPRTTNPPRASSSRGPAFDDNVVKPATGAAAQPGAGQAMPGALFPNVPRINGIVIVRSLKEFNPDGVPLKPGLSVANMPLLENPQFAQLANGFISQPMDETRMRELQREVIMYYRNHDRPLVDVLYPEQDVSNGMLQIIVIEGRLKEVRIQDKKGNPYTNGWTGVQHLHDAIHLHTNDVIADSLMAEDLDWLNRNPFRHVEAVYQPDKREYGMTSLLLRVDEQRPWSVDFGYDDSGSKATSDDRLTAGVTWGKAFGLTDHQFRYAFTFDPSLDLLRVHSASYFAPLPWRHGLRFSGYYLDVKGEVDKNVTIQGSAYQASARYEVPLPSIGKYQHEASLGIDFKNSENNLFFGELQAANTPTEVFQVAGGYTSVLPDPWGRSSLGVQGYYSPGGVTDKNTDEAFNLSHKFAKAEYLYGRVNFERDTRLPYEFTWIFRVIGQASDGNLIPSEQLGLGGFATARGYDERESNGDEGFFVSNELRTPAFGLLNLLHKPWAFDEKLQLLGFWDYGETQNVKLDEGERAHTWFSSVGTGLRYNFSRNFALRFDYGWQLIHSVSSSQRSRGHIGVVVTY